MLEDRLTIVFLVVFGIVAALVGGKITYDHYIQDKIDNCVVDNLNVLRRENPVAYRYTSISELPQVRRECEAYVRK